MDIIYLGIASGIISFTIAEMKIFEWLRDYASKKNKFLYNLLKCFWCVGFWISAIICLIYQPNLINQINAVDQVITYFIVCGISGFCGLLFKCLFKFADWVD